MEFPPKTSRLYPFLPLFILTVLYLFLALGGMTRSVTNQEAENFLQLNNPSSPLLEKVSLLQTIYFIPLNFWTKLFGTSLIAYRSFSVFFGGLVVFILFFFLKQKISPKNTIFFVALLTLNPFFIQISQHFSVHTELIFLTLLVLYWVSLVLKIIFSKRLTLLKYSLKNRFFQKIDNVIIFLKQPTRHLIFSIILAIMIISFTTISTLRNLSLKTNARKVLLTIYRIDSHRQKLEKKDTSPLVFNQDYSPSIYVENQLIAKELGQSPRRIHWHQNLSQILTSQEANDQFWYIKTQNRFANLDQKDLKNYQITDHVSLEDFSAIHFQKIK